MTPVSAGLPRILTIEDDLVLGAYVHEHLGRCGFQVTWCQNGQEGLSIARRQPFFLPVLLIIGCILEVERCCLKLGMGFIQLL